MSKGQNKKENVTEEKIMTKYDLKMQKRQKEKERAAREQKITSGVTVVLLAALVCFALSFPIRSMITLNRTYISVGGEKLNRVEFDYGYYTVVNNYINSYSAYLGYFGLDTSKDLAEQTYMGEMTWKDYFEEMAVDGIKRNKALKADAKAAGFEYDTTADYERFLSRQKEAAKEAGMSTGQYIKQAFGPYATLKRIKPYVEEAFYVTAYHEKLSKDRTPGAEEIEAVYAEDPAEYDSVDYRILQFDAVLPTEPTDLADPDAEPAGENEKYTPSDAEVEKARADAKAEAEAALKKVKTEGSLIENVKRASTNSTIRDWLYDTERKGGDTAVLEDSYSDKYYCVEFVKRYRDETPTADVRVMVAGDEEKALGIYGTWNSKGATEETFEELCNGEFYDYAVADGGLIKGVSRTEDMYEELLNWIFAEGRAKGDCEVVSVPDMASFVVYYIGEGKPDWYNTIESNLTNKAVNEYEEQLTGACEVSDPDGNLNFIRIRAAEKAAEEAKESGEENGQSQENSQDGEGDSAAE